MTSVIKDFFSNILNNPSENSADHLNNIEIDFHGQFPIDENSLNGLCIGEVYVPDEIFVNIFVYLQPQDILNCSLVCKKWCNIAKSNILWQTIYNIQEYPKKAKHLPWYVFYCHIATNNFKNLLKNGNGQEQFEYWNILLNGGHKFAIEDPPNGSDLLPEGIPEFNGYTSCFATSFENCSKYQKIELSSKRLLRYIIKKYNPTLYLSEWYCARYDCSCVYTLSVRSDTKNNKWLPENGPIRSGRRRSGSKNKETTIPIYLKSERVKIEQWAGKEWTKLEFTTKNYPTDNIDTVYFCHEGQDCQFWAGHYGSKMAGGVIKFLFESIEPMEDDIGDLIEEV